MSPKSSYWVKLVDITSENPNFGPVVSSRELCTLFSTDQFAIPNLFPKTFFRKPSDQSFNLFAAPGLSLYMQWQQEPIPTISVL